jgi:mRNA-degrading endonuclease RelE of RelBE toxin-antitoxin system
MATAQRHEGGSRSQRVSVSHTAANMISSLYPLNKSDASAALATIESSVLDPANVRKIVGVDNTFVARAGDLRVIFKKEGNSVVITSVVAPA